MFVHNLMFLSVCVCVCVSLIYYLYTNGAKNQNTCKVIGKQMHSAHSSACLASSSGGFYLLVSRERNGSFGNGPCGNPNPSSDPPRGALSKCLMSCVSASISSVSTSFVLPWLHHVAPRGD